MPTRGTDSEVEKILYRRVTDGEPVSDTAEEPDEIEGEWESLKPKAFLPGSVVPLCSVDCGVIRLGETENGLVIALRASIIASDNGRYRATIYRSLQEAGPQV